MQKMKLKSNELNKNIEQLENDYWGVTPSDTSFTIKRVYDLRTKKLEELDVEDLRLLISQNVALLYTIPLALNILETNIMSEGDYYEGDLLFSVLTSDDGFWVDNKEKATLLKEIYSDKKAIIEDFDTTDNIKHKLHDAYESFLAKYSLI